MTVVDLGAAPGPWSQVIKENSWVPREEFPRRAIARIILPMDPIERSELYSGRLPVTGILQDQQFTELR